MKIQIHTIMAHPVFGSAEPGSILDLPEADAIPLIERGAATALDPTFKLPEPQPPYRRSETAMVDKSETAMQSPHSEHGRGRGPAGRES